MRILAENETPALPTMKPGMVASLVSVNTPIFAIAWVSRFGDPKNRNESPTEFPGHGTRGESNKSDGPSRGFSVSQYLRSRRNK